MWDAVPLELGLHDQPWQYRAEGGANIVISLSRQASVLRFPKASHADPAGRLRRLADYRNQVIAPLLPERPGQPWQLVRLTAADRLQLVSAIEELRPPRRRSTTINQDGLALKMEDCAVFPIPRPPAAPAQQNVYSIEIKAKQGFLGSDDDAGLCSFCMKQYLKLRRGTVQRLSRYCPLDLFSGDFPRVSRALLALLENPQNNLRVFRDGQYVYGARPGRDQLAELPAALGLGPGAGGGPEQLLQLWTRLVFTILSTTDPDCRRASGPPAPPGPFPPARCQPGPGPPPDSFLGRVLRAQRLAAPGPTETASLYEQVTGDEEGRRRLEQLFSAAYTEPCWQPAALSEPAGPPGSLQARLARLQRYSVGATMRDCSLMLTMRRLRGPHEPESESEQYRTVTDPAGGRWLCLPRVMDLDPKHIGRVVRQRLKKDKARELYLASREASGGVDVPGPLQRSRVTDEALEQLLAVSGSPL